jgi:hypothetical protein
MLTVTGYFFTCGSETFRQNSEKPKTGGKARVFAFALACGNFFWSFFYGDFAWKAGPARNKKL